MKKILILVVAFMFFVSTVVTAEINVDVIDLYDDIIEISGGAATGEPVYVSILNPGFSLEDLPASVNDALIFYGSTISGDDGYSIEAGLHSRNDGDGGIYKIIVSTENSMEETEFNYYFYGKKIQAIRDLNTSDNIASIVNNIYTIYSQADSEIFKTTSDATIASVLENLPEIEEDVEVMNDVLRESLCVSAYKEGNEALVASGRILYADMIGLVDTPIYNDYLEMLSSDGVEAVHEKLLSAECESLDEIKESFDEFALMNLICNYKDSGYGHIKTFFAKYDDEYTEFGIDPSDINKINNKTYVYKALAKAKCDSMEEFAQAYEKALKNADSTDTSGGGGGGGGGSSSTDKYPNVVPQVSNPVAGTGVVENTKLPFGDVEEDHWARESILKLYNSKIISGKSLDSFAPADTVTREEFTKMIVLAFLGGSTETATSFGDVTGWSVPYIAKAAGLGIVNGTADGVFSPGASVTREQAATFVARVLEYKNFKSDKEAKIFGDDEKISVWAKDAVAILSSEGILVGRGNDEFAPLENVTRAEAAKIIYESMKLLGGVDVEA